MEHFLVIQAARFGDLVQTKRLIVSLMGRGTVTLLVDRSLTKLAELIYPQLEVKACAFHGQLSSELLASNEQLFSELANTDFERIYNCNFSGLSAAICRLFDPEQVMGYRPRWACSGDGGGCALTLSPWLNLVARMTQARASACLNLEDVWAHLVEDPMPGSLVNPEAGGGGGGIGIVLAGRQARRSLPPDLLASVVAVYARLAANPNLFLLGTEQEKAAAAQLRRALPGKLSAHLFDLTGKTDWAGLVDAIQGLDLLLTPDTGTMHLACHFGVPVRAFFLSSALCHETGPYGAGHIVWQAQPPCAPCLEKRACTREMACLAPFRSREFLRALACKEEGVDFEPPEYVQCYQGDFDRLGLSLRLIQGTDSYAIERMARRRLLCEFLQLHCDLPEVNAGLVERVRSLFFQDSDFMLEKDRYV